jgi:ABC-type phosphate transport system permease subunit
LWIDIELGIESVPAIQEFGLFRFLSESNWNPVTNVYSVLPQVYGTPVSDFIDLLVAKNTHYFR